MTAALELDSMLFPPSGLPTTFKQADLLYIYFSKTAFRLYIRSLDKQGAMTSLHLIRVRPAVFFINREMLVCVGCLSP